MPSAASQSTNRYAAGPRSPMPCRDGNEVGCRRMPAARSIPQFCAGTRPAIRDPAHAKRAARCRTALSLTTYCCLALPVELEAHLDLPGQEVLRRDRRRTNRTEVAVRIFRIGVDLVATEVVMVEQVECFEPELEAHALVNPGGLQQRSVHLHCRVPADLARPERREARRVVRRRHQPRVVAPVVAEIRAATEIHAGRDQADRTVVVLLEGARVP